LRNSASMANLSPQWAAMAKLVSQFYAKADSGEKSSRPRSLQDGRGDLKLRIPVSFSYPVLHSPSFVFHATLSVPSEPFREAVDWKTLGLFDYPQIIKHPTDLGTVKRKINEGKYKSLHEAGDDVRQIWKNCMTYNADGSDFYNLAEVSADEIETNQCPAK